MYVAQRTCPLSKQWYQQLFSVCGCLLSSQKGHQSDHHWGWVRTHRGPGSPQDNIPSQKWTQRENLHSRVFGVSMHDCKPTPGNMWSIEKFLNYNQPICAFFFFINDLISIWEFLKTIFGEGNGTPLQYSCLETPMDKGAWKAAVHGVAEGRTQLSDFTFSFHFSLSCIGEGNGNPLQCSCLENPRYGGAWWAAVYGVAQSQTRLKRLSFISNNQTSW